jgi:hypothetical protein
MKLKFLAVLLVLTFVSVSGVFADPPVSDIVGIYTERPGVSPAPIEDAIDVWEKTCELERVAGDSAPAEGGKECLLVYAKPGKTWWGIGWRTKGQNADITEYPYLVCSLKIDGYSSDFYVGVEGARGYPDDQFSFKIPRKDLTDGQWHQFVFDLSSKKSSLKKARLAFFVFDNDMSVRGKVFVDHVYLSKTKP